MGTVYVANDTLLGKPVALKVLAPGGEVHAERFTIESEVLSEIRHPAVVKYVAHGVSDGRAYLAMEWLEGESLAKRLAGRGLTLGESLTLGIRVVEALAELHRRGIVHRDLKPGNLFLVDGDPSLVKLLDFGIARRRARDGAALTVTGTKLGTPGYMAPEQARGDRDVDARADLFALGSVLFKCLTGASAFAGDDPLTVLFNVVFREPPRVRDLNPEVPEALDELIARLLSKAPNDRPPDADAVLRALAAIGEVPINARPVAPGKSALTVAERRVVSLVMARRAGASDAEATLALADRSKENLALEAEVHRHGAVLDWLGDGTIVIALTTEGAPTDHAANAARCALGIKPLLPDAPVAVVTGRSVVASLPPASADTAERTRGQTALAHATEIDKNPLGQLIERGHQLLDEADDAIRIDAVTAGLLDARFELAGEDGGFVLRRELESVDGSRTLLGKPTPFVGRDRDISTLLLLWNECVTEGVARAALVTAPAGIGKSRVVQEFLRKIRVPGDTEPRTERKSYPPRGPLILAGRGDPLSIGSPLGTLATALRQGLGLRGGEPAEVQREKLARRVRFAIERDEAERVTEFIGEIVGARIAKESVALRSARQDAVLMGDQMLRAWEDLLNAECGIHPVLIVLEDLHWGDLPTVKFIDAALRSLANRPLFVLAAGRPEVHERFPALWLDRDVQEIRLAQLTKKSAERIVRNVLPELDTALVNLIIERAGGHAFYLEELIRAVAQGNTDTLPETVLAMVEARLGRLDPEARRLLRAASVFGETFWEEGASLLLGDVTCGPLDPSVVDELVSVEILVRKRESKFPGASELRFRHALMREAAYAALTDADRELGHRLAGEWLEGAGEKDALLLGEHFERGGQPVRAVPFYRDAAQHALASNDFEAAIARAERGALAGAAGELLGALRLVQAEAHRWRSEGALVIERGAQALALLPRGEPSWCLAATELAVHSFVRGRVVEGIAIADDLLALAATHTRDSVPSSLLIATTRTAAQLMHAGHQERARKMVDRVEALANLSDPMVNARIHQFRSIDASFAGDLSTYKARAEAARAEFLAMGDLRNACVQQGAIGYANMALGAYEAAEEILTRGLELADRLGLKNVAAQARHNLGFALAHAGKVESGRRVEEEAVLALQASGDQRLLVGTRSYLAIIGVMAGDLAGALREAEAAVLAAEMTRTEKPFALAARAHVLLALGRAEEALASAREAQALVLSLAVVYHGDLFVRSVLVDALVASGDVSGAREVIGPARARLLEQAEKIKDPVLRRSFLENVPEHAHTMARAAEWLGDAS
jgi:tetratricopeptide (TPR) repeat protein